MDQLTDYFNGSPPSEEKWIKNAPNTTLVEHAILYTNDILYQLGIDHFPSFRVCYYNHKKYMGKFENDEIVIYTKSHESITELISTCLHEMKHFIQSKKDSDYDNYETYTKKYGIENNPLEVDARKFSQEHLHDCLLYLQSKSLVLRV